MASRGLNRATLIGNLGKDPELRKTPQGTSVCTIRLATTESYKGKSGEWLESTEWHSVVLWDRLAEIAAELLTKSDRIFVEGKISTRTYEKDGVKKHFTEIIAKNMIILDKKNKGETSSRDDVNMDLHMDNPFEDDINDEQYLTSEEAFK